MDATTSTIVFCFGIVLGGVASWLVMRNQSKLASQRLDSEHANTSEKLQESTNRAEILNSQLTALNSELTETLQKLAAAEARVEGIPKLESRISQLSDDKSGLTEDLAVFKTELAKEKEAQDEQRKILELAQKKLLEAFEALAGEALKSNNEAFLQLAKAKMEQFQQLSAGDLEKRQTAIENLVKPLTTSLGEVDKKLGEIEKERTDAYAGLKEQVTGLLTSQNQLRSETSKLIQALRTPNVRGRWGEIQLRRVVEIAGMESYCDFEEQVNVVTDDGRLRPDLVVNMPAGKQVVIDAKAPLNAYLNAQETVDETEKTAFMIEHAKQVHNHMAALGSKKYWSQFDSAPDFVIMFLPSEAFFSAALECDSSLIEEGFKHRVIPASPTTLLSLLRAIEYGWKQERISQNAQEISNLGRELYERILKVMDHISNLGRKLDSAVDSYNKAVGSIETRVMVTARRFHELGTVSEKELPAIQDVDKRARQLRVADSPES